MEGLGFAANHEHGILIISPRTVEIDGCLDALFNGSESKFEEGAGAYALGFGTSGRDQFKFRCGSRRFFRRHGDLGARYREGLDGDFGCGLPQSIANLVVVGFDLVGLHHMLRVM